MSKISIMKISNGMDEPSCQNRGCMVVNYISAYKQFFLKIPPDNPIKLDPEVRLPLSVGVKFMFLSFSAERSLSLQKLL